MSDAERARFGALYDSVSRGKRPRWQTVDPGVLAELLRLALAGRDRAQLEMLLEDAVFWVYADASGFDLRAFVRARSPAATAAAHAIGRDLAALRGAAGPTERAAQLGLAARQCGYTALAEDFDRELTRIRKGARGDGDPRLTFPWRCLWAASKPASPHFLLGDHSTPSARSQSAGSAARASSSPARTGPSRSGLRTGPRAASRSRLTSTRRTSWRSGRSQGRT